MFGFQGGETADAASRRQDYLRDARQRWGLADGVDLAAIRSAAELIALLESRLSLPRAQIASDVEAWLEGKRF